VIENLMPMKEPADKTRMFRTLLKGQALSYFEHHLRRRIETEDSEFPDNELIELVLRNIVLEYIPKLATCSQKFYLWWTLYIHKHSIEFTPKITLYLGILFELIDLKDVQPLCFLCILATTFTSSYDLAIKNIPYNLLKLPKVFQFLLILPHLRHFFKMVSSYDFTSDGILNHFLKGILFYLC
jgi:hypothetical protein